MDNLEIFDKDGKPLRIPDIIYCYLKAKAEKANKDIEDVYLGAHTFKETWIETYEAVDNGYDGINLNQYGGVDMVKNTKLI